MLLLCSYLWENHQGLTILLFLVFLAQSVAIAAMLVGRRRGRQAGRTRLQAQGEEDSDARKRIEQQVERLVRQRTAELAAALAAAKAADAAEDEMLADAGHELRTPLNVVIGLSDLARGMSEDPRLRDYMDKIGQAGRRLSDIIADLLDMSKIAAGRMELEMGAFSLGELVKRSQSAMAGEAEGKGTQLVVRVDDQIPDGLFGDALRLQQILRGLVRIAVKLTPTGPVELRIGAGNRNEERIRLAIEVAASGVGALETDIERSLEPFSQANASLTRKHGAAGLGLALCHQLAKLMDGDIVIGATAFELKIWVGLGQPTDDGQAKGEETVLAHYRNRQVLVVEDQPVNREIAEQLLLAVGIVARTARNGREALDILTEAGPAAFDLILMDIEMPEMDGLAAAREIRTRFGLGEVPIIALTAHATDRDKQIGIASGINDHIAKPFETDRFYRTLAKWLPEMNDPAGPAPLQTAPATDTLPSVPGLDTRAGLERFAGNTARYRHWLMTFVDEAPGYAAQIRSALANGRQEQARQAAHAIKGRMGMLGMTDLHAIVAAVETELRHGKPAYGLLDRMEPAVREMREELLGAFGSAQRQGGASAPRNARHEK